MSLPLHPTAVTTRLELTLESGERQHAVSFSRPTGEMREARWGTPGSGISYLWDGEKLGLPVLFSCAPHRARHVLAIRESCSEAPEEAPHPSS